MTTPSEDAYRCPLLHRRFRREGSERAVFLDRDGVLIEDTGYPDDPGKIVLLPGVGEALRRLRETGWRLVVVSNQAGVARGKFTLERLENIHDHLERLLEAEGVELDALYYCPHHPEGTREPFNVPCGHRKPEPGMLRAAAQELGLHLPACWMVGDKESDVQAAHAAGCRAVRIGEGDTEAEARAGDLLEAAGVILERERWSDGV
jgi:D-glycero-D-manno-heptose 1,7-bisphosphate phosphatase